jgi:diacylglycerol kinase (ATP)
MEGEPDGFRAKGWSRMKEIVDKTPHSTNLRRMRAKLIFNPSAGATGESQAQLMDVIREMQAWKLVPEAFLVEEGCDLPGAIQDALAQGFRMFVVCGGDGTILTVAGALIGTRATLGIIPTGTQNNVALSLGIPSDIPAAIAILRTGQRIKVDVGMAACGKVVRPFLLACMAGLASAIFPSADDIQHGNLARIGDFLAALVASPPAKMRLVLDKKQEIYTQGHVAVVSNMPYIGLHFQVSPAAAFDDGLLDVLIFTDLSKMQLLGYAAQKVVGVGTEDPRIQHFQARRVDMDTQPAMPVMADGLEMGEGSLHISVQRHALAVMVGTPAPKAAPGPDEIAEVETHAAAG